MLLALLYAVACAPSSPPSEPDDGAVIPAVDPEADARHGPPSSPAAYARSSAEAVRSALIPAVEAVGRAEARLRALEGDLPGCAATYRATAEALETRGRRADARGQALAAVLAGAARRDAEVCARLAGAPDAPASTTGVAALRARWHAVAAAVAAGADVRTEAAALAEAARSFPACVPSIVSDPAQIDAAWVAWADAVDPLFPSEPFAPWDGCGPRRAATSIATLAADHAARVPGPPPPPLPADRAAPAALPEPLLAPSRHASRADRRTFEERTFVWVPSGDPLTEVGGRPGPPNTARLARMGPDDVGHRAWLELQAAAFASLTPSQVPDELRVRAERFRRLGITSAWYNITAMRHASVTVLASQGAWIEARDALDARTPPAGPAWGVPGYAAAREAIDAELRLLAGEPGAPDALGRARAALDAAWSAVDG